MKNNWIRFLAGALVSVMLVGAFALTGGMKGGRSTDGLLYQASGLHPDGEMLAISGQTVTCEEYLFWLGMVCDNVTASMPDVDWSAAVTGDGMTFAEYAKTDAVEAAKQHAVVRAWAQQAGVALSDASTLELDAQRQQYVAYYGSEEAYLQQLALMGISEEAYDRILEDQYLYRDLYQAFCTPGSSLYADDATLTDYAAQLGYKFLWNEFCDWYLELIKPDMKEEGPRKTEAQYVLWTALREFLILMHPIMPFVTAEIWQALPGGAGSDAAVQLLPEARPGCLKPEAAARMEFVQEVIGMIRTIRAELNIAPSYRLTVLLRPSDAHQKDVLEANREVILTLARLGELIIDADGEAPKASASHVAQGCEVIVHLSGAVDFAAELARLEKELGSLRNSSQVV